MSVVFNLVGQLGLRASLIAGGVAIVASATVFIGVLYIFWGAVLIGLWLGLAIPKMALALGSSILWLATAVFEVGAILVGFLDRSRT